MAFPYPPPSQGDSDHFLFLKIAAALYEIQQGGGGGGGTVTSVGLALPVSVFSISGSPVTTTGTLTGSFTNQTANRVFAGPSTGGPAAPTFRALVAADMVAAGSAGQVQYNNGGPLGADAGLSYSAGGLMLGQAGSQVGQLTLNASGGSGSSILLFRPGGFVTELLPTATANQSISLPDASGTVLLKETFPAIAQAKKTDTSTTTSTSWVEIPGLDDVSVTVTTEGVLVRAVLQVALSTNNGESVFFRLTRNGTVLGQGDSAGARVQCHAMMNGTVTQFQTQTICIEWLDEAPGAGTHSYAVEWITSNVGTTVTAYINRSSNDGNDGSVGRAASTLTCSVQP